MCTYTVQYTSATIDYKVLKRDLYSIYMDNTVILKKRVDIICKNNLKQTVSQDFVSLFTDEEKHFTNGQNYSIYCSKDIFSKLCTSVVLYFGTGTLSALSFTMLTDKCLFRSTVLPYAVKVFVSKILPSSM